MDSYLDFGPFVPNISNDNRQVHENSFEQHFANYSGTKIFMDIILYISVVSIFPALAAFVYVFKMSQETFKRNLEIVQNMASNIFSSNVVANTCFREIFFLMPKILLRFWLCFG